MPRSPSSLPDQTASAIPGGKYIGKLLRYFQSFNADARFAKIRDLKKEYVYDRLRRNLGRGGGEKKERVPLSTLLSVKLIKQSKLIFVITSL